LALPQRHRLKGQRVFDRIYQKGRRFHAPFLVLRILEAQPQLLPAEQQTCPPSPWRCGVVVSSKVHKRAVRRNRLRRLLHAHLLAQPPAASERGLWLLLSLKPGSADLTPEALLGECSQLLHQAGLTP
jgi:ribonuclease P protein component